MSTTRGNRCTILVNSCDAFSDVWELFFKAFSIQWPDCPYKVLLNTETKDYPNDMGIEVINFPPINGRDCWGKRYKNALKSIDTPYVIPVLEDYVLKESFTGQEMIEQTMDWMDENPDIGVFYIRKHPYVIQKETEFRGFGMLPQKCDYKLATSFAVWRKVFLDKCVKGIESPWEWEVYATKRAWRFPEKMYALLESQEELFNISWGGVIRRGLWHTETKELAEKYGVDIDFSIRGVMDENDPFREKDLYKVCDHFPKDIFKGIFWKELFARFRFYWRKFICSI